MNPDMQPTSDPTGDFDIGPGGGGESLPFGGIKFKGPPNMATPAKKNITVVRTRGADWNGNVYTPATSDENSDIASYFILQPVQEGNETFAEFEYPPESGSNAVNAQRWFMENDDGVTGIVIYGGHIGVSPTNNPLYASNPPTELVCAFGAGNWPPLGNGRLMGLVTWNGSEYVLSNG